MFCLSYFTALRNERFPECFCFCLIVMAEAPLSRSESPELAVTTIRSDMAIARRTIAMHAQRSPRINAKMRRSNYRCSWISPMKREKLLFAPGIGVRKRRCFCPPQKEVFVEKHDLNKGGTREVYFCVIYLSYFEYFTKL